MRPVIDKYVIAVEDWLINSTPGGAFRDIREQLEDGHFPGSYNMLFLASGTNNISYEIGVKRSMEDLSWLISAAAKKFMGARKSEVSFQLIIKDFR